MGHNHKCSRSCSTGRMASKAGASSVVGAEILNGLFDTIASRQTALAAAKDDEERAAIAAQSWTAKLLHRGVEKCAQKVGEEGTEVVIEAIKGDKEGIMKESADLLYHLAVVWAAAGVKPTDVFAELQRRENVSGIAEKASRPK